MVLEEMVLVRTVAAAQAIVEVTEFKEMIAVMAEKAVTTYHFEVFSTYENTLQGLS